MYTPTSPVYAQYLAAIDAIAPSKSMMLIKMPVRDASEIEAAIKTFGSEPDGGLLVLPEPFFPVHQKLMVELATRYHLPTIYPFRSFTDLGGLISYSIDVPDLYRRAAGYADRILKGGVVADMPVQQPTKYELVINLKTAKALGLEVPPSLLARADDVVAAKQATSVIPIVFATVADPVGNNLVASLARPGGNVTGLSAQAPDLAGKRLELLRDVIPGLRRLAMLANADVANAVLEIGEVQAAARTLGLEVAAPEIRQAKDIGLAIDALKGHVEALYIQSDPLFTNNRVRINTLALGARLPTVAGIRELVDAGGLMSYGPNLSDLFRRAADYVDKILRGAKPGNMPVEQPTKFDLIVNLVAAKALGLTIPPTLLARADEVIE
jgi:ABC-type uncharacterized transport system substrate-binding protein